MTSIISLMRHHIITAEMLYQKAKYLDSAFLQEVADFLDFIAFKHQPLFDQLLAAKHPYFPQTSFESADDKPDYSTKTLSLEEMDVVIDHEAGLHK